MSNKNTNDFPETFVSTDWTTFWKYWKCLCYPETMKQSKSFAMNFVGRDEKCKSLTAISLDTDTWHIDACHFVHTNVGNGSLLTLNCQQWCTRIITTIVFKRVSLTTPYILAQLLLLCAMSFKPRSHIACNLSAASLRLKFRAVARILQGSCKEVGDWLQKVAGTIWSQGGLGRCKWNLSATKSIVERFLVVADRLPTGWRLIAYQLQLLQTIPTQFLFTDWSPTSRRSVTDRSPKSCRLSAIKIKRSRYSRQPVTDRSPIGCRSLPNWSPTYCRLIADWSLTGGQPLSDHTAVEYKHQVIKCTWTNVGCISYKFQWH